MGFEVLMMVRVAMLLFWVVMPCRFIGLKGTEVGDSLFL
jgi:hypothetical protein